jgi:hypothetical protein
MKIFALISAVLLSSTTFSYAQTSTTSPLPSPQTNVDTNAPLSGANSYTEAQAKELLMKNGYTDIENLKKDENGIWRATAKKASVKSVVSVDYRGNVSQK